MDNQNALEIKNLTKVYKGGLKAVDDISFEVKKGDFFALLGPNGAGKSTTLGMISSLVNKTSGQIKIFGYDIDKDYIQARKHLGVMAQEINLNIFEKPMDILVTQAGFFGISKKEAIPYAEELLKKVDLYEKRNTQVRFLSGGMKRRLMVVRALIHKPKLLILDEPTAGVDVELRNSLWEMISEFHKEGLTIILTTHYLEEAESMCKHIALIHKGKLCVNTDMKTFLKSADKHTYIFDLKEKCQHELKLDLGEVKKIDDYTIEVEVTKGVVLNKIFAELSSKYDLDVLDVRSKEAKLEKLFIEVARNK
ncbi:ABC transporter ATP-binding protein [Francisella noatunensis]|uniref:ABC transporter ATP-binding protein n=1 Tax=Francisella noatunensis TaxID=657445 RepID=A0A9Q2KWU0_9GAMM|nr:ABC transporter ATP-binding protein [Francisella noatunensis]MBK2028572.1 ABC transporter ATP-binding protein [Francisella noatunensis]MBK2034227.1 ABC transporter ATP-binding protein [Francisella noatunensis]MBK2048490.1 ABC transporter ATP-binding protein [Francisella noatunensis]MBK2050692.1 ABC transporter ATP-binding protein [Francisella noatunensis]MBK2051756.1 ABC transporter ATP-binding protein [Francisella noatunensis]